jgi:hypothetical protein
MIKFWTNRLKIRERSRELQRRLRPVFALWPLTARGAGCLVVLVWAFVRYGYLHQDHVLVGVGLAGLAGLAWCLVLTTAAAWRLHKDLHLQASNPLSLVTGIATRTGCKLPAPPFAMVLDLELEWAEPAGVTATLEPESDEIRSDLYEVATARERGMRSIIRRRLRIGDGLGLTQLELNVPQERSVEILPSPAATEMLTVFDRTASGEALPHPDGKPEGDLIEIRDYVPGDPLKRALWKFYARIGSLLVRHPERAVAPSSRTLVHLVSGEDDETAASLARAFLEERLAQGEFLFGTDTGDPPAEDARTALSQIVRSVDHRAQGGSGLAELMDRGDKLGINDGWLFVPPRPGPWLAAVEAGLLGDSSHFRVIIGVDGLIDAPPGQWTDRLFLTDPPTGVPQSELRQVMDRLAACTAEICVMDRAGLVAPPR